MANPSPFLALADRQRAEIEQADLQNLERIIQAYGLMYSRLEGDVDAVTMLIESGEYSAAELKRTRQYQRLIRNMEDELERFTAYLETAIGAAGLAAVLYGTEHSAALVNAMIGGGFTGLDANVIAPLLDYLRSDGPLYARLKMLTGSTVEAVVQAIVDGVGSGKNPRVIARLIQDNFGRGLTDALRNTRTVQIYSYRDAARANYMATGFVEGWIWHAHFDDRTCLSCVAQHGTIHPLEERLNDHYSGRCVPLPYIAKFGNPVEQSGQAWFEAQPESQQKAMMGGRKWQAWKDGKFEFSQLSQEQENDVYGIMRTEASLKQLLGEQ